MLELLNQLDGFDARGEVKVPSRVPSLLCLPERLLCLSRIAQNAALQYIVVGFQSLCIACCSQMTSALNRQVIMATNRIETLDPALLRPGRIDRKIEFPLPDIQPKRNIFKVTAFVR